MAYRIDATSGTIHLPTGDTMPLKIKLPVAEYPEGTLVILAIVNGAGTDILKKSATADSDGEADLSFVNADTRDLQAGNYFWQLRAVKDPSGSAADAESTVVSLFDGGSLRRFILEKDGAYI